MFAAVLGDAPPPVAPFTLASDASGDITRPSADGAAAGPSRPIYRHSVIAGGVYSRVELVAATERDPVVFVQYGSAARGAVRTAALPAPRRVYMSYRVGDRIYWTRKKVRLHAGEMTLTDGDIEIRARCGNQISDTGMFPVAENEPDAMEFDLVADEPDTVEFDRVVAGEPDPPASWAFAFPPLWMGDAGGASPGMTPLDNPHPLPFGPAAPGTSGGVTGPPDVRGTSTGPTTVGPPPGNDLPPPGDYAPPPWDSGPPPRDYLPPADGDVPPVTTVPEPGTFVLLGSALAGLAAIRRRQRARREGLLGPPR